MTDIAREYPFKDGQQEAVQALFDSKLAKNRETGVKVAKSGEYKPFTGFGRETMNQLFVLELQLSKETRQEIQNRVITPMKEIARELGILNKMIFAGDGDQPAHVTMHVGSFKNMDSEKQEQIRKWLAETDDKTGKHMSHLKWTTDILNGLEFQMDTIFNSGRDTSICTSNMETKNQGAAYRVRKIFEKVLDRAQAKFTSGEEKIGQHYPRYDDIFHTTVARYVEAVEPKKLELFNSRIEEEIGKELAKQPITVEVDNARTIIASQGVQERRPSLLT